MYSHLSGLENSEKQLKHEQGVWYECPVVKRFALPAGLVRLTQATAFVKHVFVTGIRYPSAMRPAKHIAVRNVE